MWHTIGPIPTESRRALAYAYIGATPDCAFNALMSATLANDRDFLAYAARADRGACGWWQ